MATLSRPASAEFRSVSLAWYGRAVGAKPRCLRWDCPAVGQLPRDCLTSFLRGEPAGPAARSSGYAGSSGFLASAVQLC